MPVALPFQAFHLTYYSILPPLADVRTTEKKIIHSMNESTGRSRLNLLTLNVRIQILHRVQNDNLQQNLFIANLPGNKILHIFAAMTKTNKSDLVQ